MKNMFLSHKFRRPFAIAFCCLGVVLAAVIVGASADGSQKASPTNQKSFTEILPGSVKLEMVAIPGGSFMMGSDERTNEGPIHKVTLKPFYMGKYEVTQVQWKAVMGNNPSHFKGDDLPVEMVSWHDAKEFCKKLTGMTGNYYRLPSEAEWEYAAKAGSTLDFCFFQYHCKLYEILLGDYAWYKENSGKKTHPVGEKYPNAWDLYDMHGNVFEWCEDVWHETYEGAPTDGSAWLTGGIREWRPKRGGSWYFDQDFLGRLHDYTHDFSDDVGFRVVSSVRPPSQ